MVLAAGPWMPELTPVTLGDALTVTRQVVQWFEADEEDDILSDDEMETLATVSFEVSSEEYILLARLGMVDTVPGGGEDDEDRAEDDQPGSDGHLPRSGGSGI